MLDFTKEPSPYGYITIGVEREEHAKEILALVGIEVDELIHWSSLSAGWLASLGISQESDTIHRIRAISDCLTHYVQKLQKDQKLVAIMTGVTLMVEDPNTNIGIFGNINRPKRLEQFPEKIWFLSKHALEIRHGVLLNLRDATGAFNAGSYVLSDSLKREYEEDQYKVLCVKYPQFIIEPLTDNVEIAALLEAMAQKEIKLPKIGMLLVETDNRDLARYGAAILGWDHTSWIKNDRDLEASCADLQKVRHDLIKTRDSLVFACTRNPRTELFRHPQLEQQVEVVLRIEGDNFIIGKLRATATETQTAQRHIDAHKPKLQEYLRLIASVDHSPINITVEMRNGILSTWLSKNIKPL
jgi:hypothetical protein